MYKQVPNQMEVASKNSHNRRTTAWLSLAPCWWQPGACESCRFWEWLNASGSMSKQSGMHVEKKQGVVWLAKAPTGRFAIVKEDVWMVASATITGHTSRKARRSSMRREKK